MFSGIVEELGKIVTLTNDKEGSSFRIGATLVTSDLKVGDSVSVNGCCLTAVKVSADSFDVEAMHETLRRTKLGNLKQGGSVNLERALKLSDRLGGHMVSGHVDGLATVIAIEPEGFSKVITFALANEFASYFIEKGSVTIDGVSLTVASVDQKKLSNGLTVASNTFLFSVALIPHTLQVTTLGALSLGDKVNVEVDVLAKYVARLMDAHRGNLALGVSQLQNV